MPINTSKTKSSCTTGSQNEASIYQATKDGTMKPLALVEKMDELGVKATIPKQYNFPDLLKYICSSLWNMLVLTATLNVEEV